MTVMGEFWRAPLPPSAMASIRRTIAICDHTAGAEIVASVPERCVGTGAQMTS